jgi:hypothetical protein
VYSDNINDARIKRSFEHDASVEKRRGPVFRLTDGDSLTDVDEPKKGNNKRGKQ